MKKHFLLLLLMTLLPLAGWSANIAVQLSTSLEKVYGSADPTTLTTAQFVIISDGGTGLHESDIAQYLTFKRKPLSTGESVGTYDWEVSVDPEYTTNNIVVTNTGRITITPLDLSAVSLSAGWTGGPFTYDGNAKEPTVTNVQVGGFTLDPSDYTVTYDNNVNAGTAKIIITAASDNVTGSNDGITFPIVKRTLSSVTIADITPVEYKKAAYDFESLNVTVTGKDAQNNEYAMSLTDFNEPVLTNATNAGEGTITLTVKEEGNFTYTEPVEKNFTINKRDISNISIASISSAYVYNGKAIQPKPALKDFEANLPNADFTRTWENNINAGEATMIVTGDRNYTGTIEVKFNIAKKDLSTVTIADIAELEYNGEAKTPELEVSFDNGDVVTLTKDVDYTVSYENNTTAGTATATITAVEGEGKNYTGTATKEFIINPVTVYIKPVAQSKFYGQADPNFAQATTPAMYELVDDEGNAVDGAVLNGTVALGRKAGETVGDYTIYVKSYTANPNPEVKDNYKPYNTWYVDDENPGSHTATFTINAQEAKLILKFKEGTPATKVYGETTYAYSVDDLEVVSGLAGSDTWETLKGGATFTPTLESENVHVDGGNKVTATITGLANYPNIEVQPLAFTVTKRKFGVKPSAQTKDYGAAISTAKTYWAKATASSYAFEEGKEDVLVELYTDEDVTTFAPGSVNEGVIKARIAEESNYELDEENSVWGTLTINAATELALDDSKDDNLTQINAFDGQNVNVSIKFSQRNAQDFFGYGQWKAENWTTLVLPFDISVADLSKAFGYAIVNVINPERTVVSGTSSEFYGKLTMKGGNGGEENGVLAANKPILIKLADNIADLNEGSFVVDFGQQTIVAPEGMTVDAGEGARFVGTYKAMAIGKDTEYNDGSIWFMLGDYSKWAFINAGSTSASWTIVPFAAYIDMSAIPEEARNMTFFFEEIDGSTTAIRSIDVDDINQKLSPEGWYNLNGVKLQGAPTQKGVYIKDGKKFVIK